jgi:hypothetical protein
MGLKEYAEYVMERNRLEGLMAVQDPRSDEEKMLAADLLATATSQHPGPIEPGTSLLVHVTLKSPRDSSVTVFSCNLCHPETAQSLFLAVIFVTQRQLSHCF